MTSTPTLGSPRLRRVQHDLEALATWARELARQLGDPSALTDEGIDQVARTARHAAHYAHRVMRVPPARVLELARALAVDADEIARLELVERFALNADFRQALGDQSWRRLQEAHDGAR